MKYETMGKSTPCFFGRTENLADLILMAGESKGGYYFEVCCLG